MKETNPFDELARIDRKAEEAYEEERRNCWCPNTHPKPPTGIEEGVTSLDGTRNVDIMRDTPPIGQELSLQVPVNGTTDDSILALDIDESLGGLW